ncbi:conserved hypothetical protein [Gammaproteobacteria bacterium]
MDTPNTTAIPGASATLDQVTTSLTLLTAALASAEQRTARLERIVRWGALVFVAFLGIASMLVYNPMGVAFATLTEPSSDAKRVADALENINNNLAVFGQVGQLGAILGKEVPMAIMNNKDTWNLIKINHPNECKEDTDKPNCMKDYAMSDIVGSMVNVTANMMVLIGRIRWNSDKVREFLSAASDGPSFLDAIGKELHLMNTALASVPIMAIQMDAMNRQMSVMSYSVGSTMGRMGNWMP